MSGVRGRAMVEAALALLRQRENENNPEIIDTTNSVIHSIDDNDILEGHNNIEDVLGLGDLLENGNVLTNVMFEDNEDLASQLLFDGVEIEIPHTARAEDSPDLDSSYRPSCSETDSDTDPDEISEKSEKQDDEHLLSDGNSEKTEKQDDENDRNKPSKKRKRRPELWLKTKAKIARNSGECYVSSSNSRKFLHARRVKPACDTNKCKLKCSLNFDSASRESIFKRYWGLKSLSLQREFIARSMKDIEGKNRRYSKSSSNARSLNKEYHFENEDGNKFRVCKKFFLSTLDITDRAVRTVKSKLKQNFLQPDQRGKHQKHIKLDPEIVAGIKEHIESIPRLESHYLRAQTTREYVEGGRNLTDLYRDYKNICIARKAKYASKTSYCKIFNFEYNISFHSPKKDQCDLCAQYKNALGSQKEELKQRYDAHIHEKELSRKEKAIDKEMAKENPGTLVVGCYDLQAIMPCPKGNTSVFYYKSKLSCYNLTICNIASMNADCYFWYETQGKKGAIEISTCVFRYLEHIAATLNSDNLEIILYSDNCGGQQKNQFLFAMYMHAVRTLKIKSITHKFLIRGHSQNEGDNIHAVIEKHVRTALKGGPIFEPGQYVSLIKGAKKNGVPYRVHELYYKDFIDWVSVSKNYPTVSAETLMIVCDNCSINRKPKRRCGTKKMVAATNAQSEREQSCVHCVQNTVGDIKVFKVEKDQDGIFFYKSSFGDTNFKKIDFSKRKARGKPEVVINKAYSAPIALGENKKKDLKSLVDGNHIPPFYLHFYDTIL